MNQRQVSEVRPIALAMIATAEDAGATPDDIVFAAAVVAAAYLADQTDGHLDDFARVTREMVEASARKTGSASYERDDAAAVALVVPVRHAAG